MELIVFWLYRALGNTIALLPLGGAIRAGRLLGWLGYWLAGKYRRMALHNLTIAFPEMRERKRRKLARSHFSTLVGNLFAAEKIARIPRDRLMDLVRIVGMEEINRLEAEKRGFVFVISHIGNWELLAQIGPLVFPNSNGTVYQRLGNRHMDRHIREVRSRIGLALFERKEGFNAACEMLRAAGGVGVLMDQHAGDAGVWCPLFGRLASTTSLPALLALRSGAALVPVAMHTDGIGRWRMVIDEAIETKGLNSGTLTLALNQALEKQIRRAPADWFWVHNRWKTPKPKFLLAAYKRGIVLPPSPTEPVDASDGELFEHVARKAASSKLQPFKILIRSSNWLGDAVMTIPAVRAIKKGRPDAHITILSPGKLADIWRLVPEVDNVLPFDAPSGRFRGLKKLFQPWKIACKLRGHRFDAAVLLPNSIRAAVEVWLAGIPRRVGYPGHKGRPLFLNQVLREKKRKKEDKDGKPKHQVHHYLKLAEFIGAEIPEMPFALARPPRAESATLRIAVCPGAEYGPAKRWPADRFAEVIRTVNLTRACEWVIVGTFKDRPVGEEILEHAGKPANVENRCGQTSLEQLIAMLRSCDALLTNDTGTMHLAALLGVPTVSIFGSTEPALTGPLGTGHTVLRKKVDCSPCFLRECPIDFRCMMAIHPRDVAVELLMRVAKR